MASLFDVDISSDPDDCDYEPHADELLTDEEEDKASSKKASKISDGNKMISQINEKNKKADDVYKGFLNEVAAESKHAKIDFISSGVPVSESNTSSTVGLNNDKSSYQSSASNIPDKLTELAKKTLTVNAADIWNSEMASSSNSKGIQNTSSITSATSVVYKRKSLDSILGNYLSKKQKMTTLTKSLLDWKIFKEEEGIEEELSSYNRGKGGFIERKKFLERSDARSFEIERNIRLAKRQPKKSI